MPPAAHRRWGWAQLILVPPGGEVSCQEARCRETGPSRGAPSPRLPREGRSPELCPLRGAGRSRGAGGGSGGCPGLGAALEGPWDAHLLALPLTVSQEQLQAPEVESEDLLFGDGEQEAPEVQASDDAVPDGAALPVVAAEATGLIQPDHLGVRESGAGWRRQARRGRGLGPAGRRGSPLTAATRGCCPDPVASGTSCARGAGWRGRLKTPPEPEGLPGPRDARPGPAARKH